MKLKQNDKNGYSKNLDELLALETNNNGNLDNKTEKSSTKENTEYVEPSERFLFENKLDVELGPLHKFKHTSRETKFHKPLFLKNRLTNKKKSKSYRNNLIVYNDLNHIVISKSILKNETDVNRIIIDKNKIRNYL
jgi:hypothetical protein